MSATSTPLAIAVWVPMRRASARNISPTHRSRTSMSRPSLPPTRRPAMRPNSSPRTITAAGGAWLPPGMTSRLDRSRFAQRVGGRECASGWRSLRLAQPRDVACPDELGDVRGYPFRSARDEALERLYHFGIELDAAV